MYDCCSMFKNTLSVSLQVVLYADHLLGQTVHTSVHVETNYPASRSKTKNVLKQCLASASQK